MARLALDSVKLVLRSIEQRLVMAGDMTRHAPAGVLFRLSMKPEDQLFRGSSLLVVATRIFDPLNMCLAGSVTAFASGPFSRFLTGCDALVVRILVEPGENVRMTSPANGAAHVSRIGCRLRDQQDWSTKY